MIDIVKIASRVYRCCDCGNEVVTETNHRAPIYVRCRGKCRTILYAHTSREIVMPAYPKHEFVKDMDT
jgi:DNA-directed RNA polymerase subunit RPC12/RpoP